MNQLFNDRLTITQGMPFYSALEYLVALGYVTTIGLYSFEEWPLLNKWDYSYQKLTDQVMKYTFCVRIASYSSNSKNDQYLVLFIIVVLI